MRNPLKFRPDDPDETDWEDNPLSNAMAWASRTVWPRACATPEHWTSRLSAPLWTDCPCCLWWRGAIFGAIAGLATQLIF